MIKEFKCKDLVDELKPMSQRTIIERLEEIDEILKDEYDISTGWFNRGYAEERLDIFRIAKELLLRSIELQEENK